MTWLPWKRGSHYYVFILSQYGSIYYERTCDTPDGASDWVKFHVKRGLSAFWMVDRLPKKYFY